MISETIKRILQVEDHQDTANMLTIFLREIGYRVETIGTCKEGVEAIQVKRFDLFLFDNLLPDGTGIELCKEIRKNDQDSPIIFHSGAADQNDKVAALAAGANAYVIKPADLDELTATVKRLLDGKSID